MQSQLRRSTHLSTAPWTWETLEHKHHKQQQQQKILEEPFLKWVQSARSTCCAAN